MDEMRIVSKFTRGIISKAIKMVIRKKTGYNIDIQLNEAITTISDGKTHLHLDVDAELDKDELMSILTSLGLNYPRGANTTPLSFYFAKFTRHIMRDSSSVGERETIKVPKSMVRVHPVSLLFLQKGESGCLSNNLTYYYAIRIRWMRGFHSVGKGRKSLKNRAIRYGLLMSWKDTSSVDFIQKNLERLKISSYLLVISGE